MPARQWLFASVILGAAGALAPASTQAQLPDLTPEVLKGGVIGNDGKTIGTATVTGTDRVTIVRLDLQPGALTPGWHGIHFHAEGDCSDTAKFLASKGHVNHHGAAHGLLNPKGPDQGDLPNIHAASDGSVMAEVSSPTGLTGADGLKGPNGFALVIHANADDHTTQPIGGAGARVGCAAFKP